MKVVILCGGFGTRIRDVADNIPKPMIPVGGRPILWHIMKTYAQAGFKDFVLCLGYKGQVIKDFFLNYEAHTNDCTLHLGGNKPVEFLTDHSEADWRVTLVETGANANTGARVRRIRKYVEADEHFMLTYGDGLGTVDIKSLVSYHKEHGRILTVTGVRPPSRFGEIVADEQGAISSFNEKPQVGSGRISGGYFVCQRNLFEYLDDREDLVFETDPINRLVTAQQLMMFKHDGFWQPMDTHREYTYLNELFEKGKAPWIVWDK